MLSVSQCAVLITGNGQREILRKSESIINVFMVIFFFWVQLLMLYPWRKQV